MLARHESRLKIIIEIYCLLVIILPLFIFTGRYWRFCVFSWILGGRVFRISSCTKFLRLAFLGWIYQFYLADSLDLVYALTIDILLRYSRPRLSRCYHVFGKVGGTFVCSFWGNSHHKLIIKHICNPNTATTRFNRTTTGHRWWARCQAVGWLELGCYLSHHTPFHTLWQWPLSWYWSRCHHLWGLSSLEL